MSFHDWDNINIMKQVDNYRISPSWFTITHEQIVRGGLGWGREGGLEIIQTTIE